MALGSKRLVRGLNTRVLNIECECTFICPCDECVQN